ncbi:TRAP transporter small permease [Maritimibacter alkaliphilus]|uniref:TRAP transporter small permease n=1 Tax=Maritimibacter alkaliphilus TaxID=404236 RepID=UPI001C982CB9|nr:TRAP transporter small permease [Maritimibacter alkaliphilus]MBY6091841.1 TRAP transporter small permease [Maritimibacter alkaliphilus]
MNTLGPVSAGPVFDLAETLTRFLTGLVLCFLVLLVCAEALLRGGFNYSLGFAEELTGYCVVLLTFLGAALALRHGSLFRVHFLFDALSPTAKTWIARVFVLIALVICVTLAWKTKDLMLSSLSRGKFAPTVLRTPLWIPQMVMPAGFLVIGFFLVEQLLLTFRSSNESN